MNRDFFIGITSVQGSVYHAGILFLNGAGFWGRVSVNSAQTYDAAALAGLGLIQAPLLGIGQYFKNGSLVEIMPDFRRRALPVSLIVAHRSNLSRRVRVFMKWIEEVLTPYLEQGDEPLVQT
ncbi:LysR substrate-binding domain-containing protein [Serratia liquefaciens]|uniref:LysR substrate-binding domain-containing protein n=1 Tax=Serratia liquefaciens TaxID=614 RepID=UPI0022B97CBB|nr:LysR substrate-binding domain-containing protein [Serratia liquefaciens]